ncbi:MAG TPA: signal peptidase I [Bacillota bacterium]
MQKKRWSEWMKVIVIAIFLAIFFRSFIFATSIVEGESMEPTLTDGERVVFNKFIYLFNQPKRGDIVIIQRPLKTYVKRVIGLPGETILIKDHTLYIDGEVYEQTFLTEESQIRTGNFGPVVVPNDSYFVMGDHRAISKDSRNGLGFVEEDDIIGRSEVIVYPITAWSLTR